MKFLLLLLVNALFMTSAGAYQRISQIDKKSKDYHVKLSISGNGFNLNQQLVPVTGAMRPHNKAWANAKVLFNDTQYETNIAYSGNKLTLNMPITVPSKVGQYAITDHGQAPSPIRQIHIYGSIRDLGSYRATSGQLTITRLVKDTAGNSILEGHFTSEITVRNKGQYQLNGTLKIVDYANKMCCQ